jgi:hypothetical protein
MSDTSMAGSIMLKRRNPTFMSLKSRAMRCKFLLKAVQTGYRRY